jgi:aspartyl-tRNA(Asn)/glutamyl-tRNA(Gln) amidotransferase subunit A
VGFLTRTVEDTQLIWRALEKTPDPPAPSPIRVGIARAYFFDDLEAPVTAAMSQALAHMKTRGAILSDVNLPASLKTMADSTFDTVFLFEFWGRYGADWRARPGAFSPALAAMFKNPRPSAAKYEAALVELEGYQTDVDRLFEAVDVVVTPTVPVIAPPIAGPIDGAKLLRNTWPFNPAGTPAISIPIEASGLPLGLQLVARRGDDDRLLRIARTFEEALARRV